MVITKIEIHIVGIKPIILNQYVSIEEKNIPAEKKLTIADNKIVITSDRMIQFLIGEMPAGCIKLFTDTKKFKTLIQKAKANIGIFPRLIPIAKADEYIVREDKVVGGTVPKIIKRPMIENWEAKFSINLVENPNIHYETLESWFNRGGIEVGLGAWRPVYGQFIVEKFEKVLNDMKFNVAKQSKTKQSEA